LITTFEFRALHAPPPADQREPVDRDVRRVLDAKQRKLEEAGGVAHRRHVDRRILDLEVRPPPTFDAQAARDDGSFAVERAAVPHDPDRVPRRNAH
jgi:hypothetical protein